MILFSCPSCSRRLYFENSRCLACGTQVVLDPSAAQFVATDATTAPMCINAGECACNWKAEERFGGFCHACALNRTIPDLSIEGNRDRWTRVEKAKRRVVFALLGFDLAVEPKSGPDDEAGLAFDFLANEVGAGPGGERILTGHDNGLITLNVAEADSPERERMRLAMGERYRTLLGHFRHELGHYYWDRLIRDDPGRLETFRALFGDDREDYGEALKRHYAQGPAPGWEQNRISAYAASHPWEDWAETWAHYLHIADTLEMAEAFAVPVEEIDATATGQAQFGVSPAMERMLGNWLALSETVNGINRCMGLPDLYPFVISGPVAAKLDFVHGLLGAGRNDS